MIDRVYGKDFPTLCFALVEASELEIGISSSFSMKKEWKDPRKALEYLDTISKNGYNNSVD